MFSTEPPRISSPVGVTRVAVPCLGVLLPKGAYYRYLNTGEGNLVVLGIGSIVRDKPKQGAATRVTPTGEEILGGSVENKSLPPIYMEKFFADEAR